MTSCSDALSQQKECGTWMKCFFFCGNARTQLKTQNDNIWDHKSNNKQSKAEDEHRKNNWGKKNESQRQTITNCRYFKNSPVSSKQPHLHRLCRLDKFFFILNLLSIKHTSFSFFVIFLVSLNFNGAKIAILIFVGIYSFNLFNIFHEVKSMFIVIFPFQVYFSYK